MELFDMINDPGQFTNLASVPEYKDVVSHFRSSLVYRLKIVRTNDLNLDYN